MRTVGWVSQARLFETHRLVNAWWVSKTRPTLQEPGRNAWEKGSNSRGGPEAMTRRTPMSTTSCRKFTLLDVMILVAAAAVALHLSKLRPADISGSARS